MIPESLVRPPELIFNTVAGVVPAPGIPPNKPATILPIPCPINSLLGLEIVDQLNIDVDEFQKRSVLQLKTNEEKKNINKLKKEVDGFEDRIKEIDESIVKVEDELAKKAYDIRELNVVLSQKGISYYEKKQEYEKELQVIDEKRTEISDELVKLASGDLPLLVVKKELSTMVDQSKSLLENQNKTDSQKKNNDFGMVQHQ